MDPNTQETELPVFSGWHTVEKLGEGGMCVVYRVLAPDGTERALKVLQDVSAKGALKRFVEEARLLQRIEHPNVVKVHSLAEDERPPWLVMDLLAGRDLEETMQLEGRMDPERAARLFADLASGLAAVHAIGIRHRDLKPANIRLGTDGVARLIDFGIARDASSARQTRQGFVVGTASYLPPEIFSEDDTRGIQDTETADVYALGQTLYEVLVGEPSHVAREGTDTSLLVRVMREKLEWACLDPRERGVKVPEELAGIVRRATAREPEDRTPSAKVLEQQLRAWLKTRHARGEIAPISRADLSALEVPLTPPAALRRTPAPAPVRTSPADRGGRSAATGLAAVGAVGAMGVAGLVVVLLGLAAFAALGVIALIAFAP